MKLWTIHRRGFSLTEGRADRTLSPYVGTVANYIQISQQLWERLGTSDQVIWCCTKPIDRRHRSLDEIEWVLEVPDAEILALIDDHVWNRILGLKCHPPQRLRDQWRDRALDLHPNDSDARERYHAEQERSYFAQEPPSGDWWNHVFVDDLEGDSISAVIRHPVRQEWIVGRNPSA
jgi:hypothetical protein